MPASPAASPALRSPLLLALAAAAFVAPALSVAGCPAPAPDTPAPAGEGEGEGAPAEGEGEGVPAGEGEGEGAPAGEGEGEGTAAGEGEGEGAPAGEGEGEGEGQAGPSVDVIVGVGYGGIRILSVDHGETWCESAIDDPQGGDDPRLLREVTVGQGQFVAAGWDHVYTSPNGWAWTDVTGGQGTPSGQWIGGIRYDGAGTWLSCGGFGTAMRSSDGHNWQSIDYPGTAAGREMAFGNGQFVCSDDDGWKATTDGGQSWQSIPGSGRVELRDGSFQQDDELFPGFGVTVRYDWPNGVAVSGNGHGFQIQFTPREPIERFAFSTVSAGAFAVDQMPSTLRQCLGL